MKCPDCKRPRSKCRRFADELARGMRTDMGGTDAVIASECALAAECARLTAQLAAATARAGEAAPQAVTGVVRKKMGNGARYIELDDHPHLTTAPRLPSKCGNGYIVEVRPLRAGGGR